jgi:hypothetical protein
VYELLYDGEGQDGTPFLPGLLDVSKLAAGSYTYDEKKSGLLGNWSGDSSNKSALGRPQVGGVSGPGRVPKNGATQEECEAFENNAEKSSESTPREAKKGEHHTVGERRRRSSQSGKVR